MAKIEIDEADLVQLKVLQDFVQKGLQNPETRKLLKSAERKLYPDRAVPEEDAKAEVLDELGKFRSEISEKFAALEKEKSERAEAESKAAVARQWQQGQAKARAAGYTDEGLASLEKFMEERGVFDHDLAIPAFERLHPPPEPTTSGNGTSWNMFDIPKEAPDMQALLEGRDEEFLNTTIPQVLREIRGR